MIGRGGFRTARGRACAAILLTAAQWAGCGKEGERADSRALSVPAKEPPAGDWFIDITRDVGLNFTYETGATGRYHFAEIMVGGVALFDYDNDGDLDLYFTNGHRQLPKLLGAGNERNRLFRRDPDGRYTDVTTESGLGDVGYGMGVAVGDVDNDGDLDVFVTNFGPDRLYLNRGDGRFEDVTERAGIDVNGWSSSAAFFDMDADGFLDLYVARYIEHNPLNACYDQAGRPDYCSPKSGPPVPDVLLHNNSRSGAVKFTDISDSAGISAVAAAGLGVVCDDFDDDGRIDVYVANDGYPNQLWINRGDGTFDEKAFMLGVALNMAGKAEAGMGVIAADFDNDLTVDLFMTHLREESNTLYRNLGSSLGFRDASADSGLGADSLPLTGFGTAAFDMDLDGSLDIVVVNGRVVRGELVPGASVPSFWQPYAEPNFVYLGDGKGRFSGLGSRAGRLASSIEVSRGLAVGDIDEDGDVDLVVSNLQSPARLYRNVGPRHGHWLRVGALDPDLNREAAGSRVTVTCGDRRWMRTVGGSFSYLSFSESTAHFGLGSCDRVDRIDVRWLGGPAERFPGVQADQSIVLRRGGGVPMP